MTTFGYSPLLDAGDNAAIQRIASTMIDHLQMSEGSEATVRRLHLMDVLADLCWLAQTSEFVDAVARIESLLDNILEGYDQCTDCGSMMLSSDRHHEFPELCWDCGDAEMLTSDETAETV